MNRYELALAMQNIYSGDEVWGGEFLCRVKKDSKITSPSDMLENVRSRGKQYNFDLVFIEMTMQIINQEKIHRAFINIHPESLDESELPDRIYAMSVEYCVPPESIVLEITEESPILDWGKTLGVLKSLKNYGYHIAIDDFGCAYSNLERLLKLYSYVDYIKIDNTVHGNESTLFDDIVLNHLPDNIKNRIIAERIECYEESSHLTSLGICLHQGYLYHMPTLQGVTRIFVL